MFYIFIFQEGSSPYNMNHIICIIFFIYDFMKAIIDSIRLYFDFIDDLLDLGFVSHDSLNNLNDFYMGKDHNEVFYLLRNY